jgi:hypothetical protein
MQAPIIKMADLCIGFSCFKKAMLSELKSIIGWFFTRRQENVGFPA